MKKIKHIAFIVIACTGLFAIALSSYTKKYNTKKKYLIAIVSPLHYLSKHKLEKEIAILVDKSKPEENLLQKIEHKLHQNSWIKAAQVYKNSQQEIRVYIKEKQPILRIFTKNHFSFFVDEKLNIISNISNVNSPLTAICMNFPAHKVDNNMLACLIKWIKAIQLNKPLSNHFSYFNYVDKNTIEIINVHGSPTTIVPITANPYKVANQIAYLYSKILPVIGWDYYKSLNFTFKNQIVSVKNYIN